MAISPELELAIRERWIQINKEMPPSRIDGPAAPVKSQNGMKPHCKPKALNAKTQARIVGLRRYGMTYAEISEVTGFSIEMVGEVIKDIARNRKNPPCRTPTISL